MVRVLLLGLLVAVYGCGSSAPDSSLAVAADQEDTSDSVFDDSIIHDIRMDLTPEAVAVLRLQTTRSVPRVDVAANLVFDGESVAAETHLRGSIGSFRPFDDKPGFKVKFSPRWRGLKSVTLHNNVQDSSFTANYLAYSLYRDRGQPARRIGWAKLTVNGQYRGVYVITEDVDRSFLRRWFDDAEGNLYKCEVIDGSQRRCDFDNAPEWTKEVNDDDPARAELDRVANVIATTPVVDLPAALTPLFDTENFRTFWVLEDLLFHWDGYIASPRNNNYYVYHHPSRDKFYMIPSGMDQTFDGIDLPALGVNSVVAKALAGAPGEPGSIDEVRSEVIRSWDKPRLHGRIDNAHSVIGTALLGQPSPVDSHREFQLKMSRIELSVDQRPSALAARTCTQASVPVVSYGGSTFQYQVAAAQASGWQAPAFDDSSWSSATGSLGAGSTCPLRPTHEWPLDSTVFTRLHFSLPDPASVCSVKIGLMLDDVADSVYLNGVEITSRPFINNRCAAPDVIILYPPRDLWRQGDNVLAVKARDLGGNSYYDHRVSFKSVGP